MARLPVPTNILDIKGSFIVHPEREEARRHEPTSDQPLGDPPARLNADCKAIWVEVADELCPGVAHRSDRQMFEVLVRLIAKIRAGTIRMAELSALMSLCGRFAMTPSDRSRVTVDAAPSSALTRFLANRAAASKKTDA